MEPTANSGESRWPRIIALGLAFVIVVNIVFAYLAIHGADSIVSSYNTEAR